MKHAMDYAKRIAYSSEETLELSFEMAKKYRDGPGFLVECGVAAGAQIIAFAAGAYPKPKTILAFDSFQGIPLPSNQDDQMPGIRMLSSEEIAQLPPPGEQKLVSSGATSVSFNDFWFNINAALGNVDFYFNIHPKTGWFEETMPDVSIDFKRFGWTIDVLRLDGDLYNSTRVCLDNLFPFVNDDGCVIIDDWTLPGCRKACDDFFKSIDYTPDYKYLSDIAYFYK